MLLLKVFKDPHEFDEGTLNGRFKSDNNLGYYIQDVKSNPFLTNECWIRVNGLN